GMNAKYGEGGGVGPPPPILHRPIELFHPPGRDHPPHREPVYVPFFFYASCAPAGGRRPRAGGGVAIPRRAGASAGLVFFSLLRNPIDPLNAPIFARPGPHVQRTIS